MKTANHRFHRFSRIIKILLFNPWFHYVFPAFILLASPALGALSIPIIEDEDDLYDLLLTEELTYDQYLDLLNLLRKGVDINTDERMELIKIPGVSESDILRITKFKKERETLAPKQIKDFKEISILDEDTYRRLLPFIRVLPRKPRAFKGRLRFQVKETLDDKQTAEIYNQLRLYYGRHTQAYISTKKEEGENEFEIIYRYLKLEGLGPIKEIALGDYKAYFGQRLVIGHGFDGAMIHLHLGRFEPAIVYSYPMEKERVVGGNLDLSFFRDGKGKVGGSYLAYGNDSQGVYGIHLNLPIKDIEVFSEWARVNDGGTGFIGGANLEIEPIELLASYRNYDQDFDNPYSDGFADADGEDDDQDEEGLYLELKYRLGLKWRVIGSFNQWRHPSNLTSDSEKALKVYYDLSSRTKFRLLREYKDEDIDREGHKKTKTSLEAIFHPLTKSKTSLYVRCAEKDVTTSADRQVNVYARLKLEYEVSASLELEGAIKFKDTDIYEAGQSQATYYLQCKNKLNDQLAFLLRYTNTAYSLEHDPPNPKHELKFRLDMTW